MEWIRVDDKLPDEGKEYTYLITDGKEISIGYLDFNQSSLDDDELYWIDETHALSTCIYGWPKVTHWSKLPNLPKDI